MSDRYLKPHRGSMILVLGILGLVVCPICGIVAWIMGNGDLREIRGGYMDPEGEGLTNAGRIVGMIATILMLISIIVPLVILLVMLVIGAGVAAGAG